MRYDRVLETSQFSDSLLRRRLRDHPTTRPLRIEYFADLNSGLIDHETRSSIKAMDQLISLGLSHEFLVFLTNALSKRLRTRLQLSSHKTREVGRILEA